MKKQRMHGMVWCGSALLFFLGSLCKISLVWGNTFFCFTGVSIVGALVGVYAGLPFLMLCIVVSHAMKAVILGTSISMLSITYGLPTIISALFLRISLKMKSEIDIEKRLAYQVIDGVLRLLVPGVCLLLFLLHPSGKGAFLYGCYWFIPMILYVVDNVFFFGSRRKMLRLFSSSLSATFLAHAVGSVLWVYAIPMTTAQWLALIPVVAVERLTFASGMSVLYLLIEIASKKYASMQRDKAAIIRDIKT